MKMKESVVTGLALLAIAVVGLLAYRYEVRPQAEFCKLCQRPIHAGVAYELDLKDGTRERACCPRCAMHYQVDRPDMVRTAWATDLASGKLVPAEAAYYVEGGDLQYCTVGDSPVQREPQGVASRQFDRCLPTLVAFRTRGEADDYHRQHGGRVLTYTEALESVRTQ